ncbi:MAG: SMP-30/gluconolactonase/LRE family protein [Thermomicrobiales bacterium]
MSNPPRIQEPEPIADTRCQTGEGPLWRPDERHVYWVDIPAGHLFRYDPATGTHERVLATEAIGGLTVQEDGSLLLLMARGAVRTWRDGKLTTVVEEIPEVQDSRFNDVIADPAGRVFGGTMPTDTHPGYLYRVESDGSYVKVLDGLGVPNGMGFTPDLRGMYFTDSTARTIYLFDYDQTTGNLTNQRIFVQTPDDGSVPDGMTVDADGYVWSARWDGSALYRYAPNGDEVLRIPFPAKKVSSAIFGGPDYDELYVTTAGGQDRATEGAGAGALFRLDPGVAGRPEFRSRVRTS